MRTATKKDCIVSSWAGGTRVTSAVPTYPLSTLQYFSNASNTLRSGRCTLRQLQSTTCLHLSCRRRLCVHVHLQPSTHLQPHS
jgi:hypothetical protein